MKTDRFVLLLLILLLLGHPPARAVDGKTIDDFTALTSAATGDELPIYDISASSPRTRKITIGNLSLAITPAWSAITGKPTFPSGAIVGSSDTQTLTNKTISGASNTLTVRLASDVTGTLPQANGGAPPWQAKSTTYTALAGDRLACDLTSAGFTVTLPASPTAGDSVRVLDAQGQAATHTLTVARNGQSIDGSASDLTITTNNADVELIFVGGSKGWQISRIQ